MDNVKYNNPSAPESFAAATNPATDVTVTVWFPVGVDERVERLRVVVQVRKQFVCEKVPVAPKGSPDTANPADAAAPDSSVAFMVFDADWPGAIEIDPPFERA